MAHARIKISMYTKIRHTFVPSTSPTHFKEMPQSWTAFFLSPGARRPCWRKIMHNSKPFLVCLILQLSVYVSTSYSYLGRNSHFPALMISLFLAELTFLKYFLWKYSHFWAPVDRSTLLNFHFCHTSLIIFTFLVFSRRPSSVLAKSLSNHKPFWCA